MRAYYLYLLVPSVLVLITACDPNAKPEYGNTGLPKNCRAYVQVVINDYKAKRHTADEADGRARKKLRRARYLVVHAITKERGSVTPTNTMHSIRDFPRQFYHGSGGLFTQFQYLRCASILSLGGAFI